MTPKSLSARRCFSGALEKYGDHLLWLGGLNGSFFLLDRLAVFAYGADQEGLLGLVASLAGMAILFGYMAVSVVVSHRLATGLPLGRAVWHATLRFIPSSFRLILLFLIPLAVVGIPSYLVIERLVTSPDVAIRISTALTTVPLIILLAGFAFSPYYVLEGMRVRPSLKASWRAASGHLWAVIVLSVPIALSTVAVALTINTGLWEHGAIWLQNMVLYPISNTALAIAFVVLRDQAEPRELDHGLAPIKPN